MSTPRLRCQIGFAAGPNDPISSIDWTDVTARIRGEHSLNPCHRQHELGRFETGTSSGAFDNRDRGLDPVELGGPMRPRLPIRYFSEWASEDFPMFLGYVEGQGLRYSGGVDAFVVVEAADAFKQSVRYKPKLSPYSLRVLEEAPALYWRLGDTAGRTALDISGNGHHGQMSDGVVTGVGGGLVADSDTGVLLPANSNINGGDIFNFERTDAFSITGRVFIARAATTRVCHRRNPTTGQGWSLVIINGYLDFGLTNTGSNRLFVESGYRLDDQRWNEMAVIYDGSSTAAGITFIVNGQDAGRKTIVDSPLTATIQTANDFMAGPASGALSQVYLDELAIFESAISLDFARALFETARYPWRGQRAGERIDHLLDLQGWHPDDRDIARGVANLDPLSAEIASVLEHGHQVADSEVGSLYVLPDGRYAFDDRYAGIFGSTSVATFAEPD